MTTPKRRTKKEGSKNHPVSPTLKTKRADADNCPSEPSKLPKKPSDGSLKNEITVDEVETRFKEGDPSDFEMHDYLLEVICRYNNEAAIRAAQLIGECNGFSGGEDMEIIEELQRAAVCHSSLKVRGVLLDSLEEIFDCGLDEEISPIGGEDDGMDTREYCGSPDESASTLHSIAPHEKTYDYLISYASEQRQSIVVPFVAQLEALGLSVWVDFNSEIPAGSRLKKKIFEKLKYAKCHCLILSREYFSKYWTCREFNEISGLATFSDHSTWYIPLLCGISNEELIAIKIDLKNSGKLYERGRCRMVDDIDPGNEIDEYFFDNLTKYEKPVITEKNLRTIALWFNDVVDRYNRKHLIISPARSLRSEVVRLGDSDLESHKHNKEKKHDVFISYASSQWNPVVTPLIASLDSVGITTWNPYCEESGELKDERMDLFEVLDKANCVVVILSKEYFTDRSLLIELNCLRGLNKFVGVPVLPLLFKISIQDVNKAIHRSASGWKEELEDWLKRIKCGVIRKNTLTKTAADIKSFVVDRSGL